jgi:hypothetical protein
LITCEEASEAAMIIVKSVNIVAGGDYSVDLPAGDYQVVVSSFGMVTQTADVSVTSGVETTNVTFDMISTP